MKLRKDTAKITKFLLYDIPECPLGKINVMAYTNENAITKMMTSE